MKKVLTILIALAMIFSMAGVVSAEDTQDISGTSDSSGNTEVTYETEQGYTVTIPIKVSFSEGNLESENLVKATNVLIPDGALLEVTISSGVDGFNLVYGSGLTNSKIPYSVIKYDGNAANDGDAVLQVPSNVKESSAPLTFLTTEENVKQATMSGEHKDTLTFTISVSGGSSSGEGTEEPTVIYIGDKATLFAFAKDVNENGNTYAGKTVKLTANIDLENDEWTPIGQTGGYYAKTYFQGTFDGQGHTISNLKITQTNTGSNYAVGLFGFIDAASATIKNVKVDGAEIHGHHWVGTIAGYLTGTIDNCEVTNSMIIATNANNDANGDKVGGIAGFVNTGGEKTVTNNKVSNSYIIGYRDVGGILGHGGNLAIFTGNSVENVHIVYQNNNGAEIIGRPESFEIDTSSNTYDSETLVQQVTATVSTTDGLKTALSQVTKDTPAVIFLIPSDTSYVLNAGFSFVKDSQITLISADAEKTEINLDGTNNNVQTASGCTLVFERLTLTRAETGKYQGIQHIAYETYNDCIIKGQHFLYGTESEFNDCIFITNNADNYNVWTYGASEVTFNNCQFNCAGKSVLIYNEGGNGQVANFNDCTFTASAPAEGKAAIEIDSSLISGMYTVNIDSETTATGFAEGSVSGNTLWNVKKDSTPSKSTVIVNSETVYPSNP